MQNLARYTQYSNFKSYI